MKKQENDYWIKIDFISQIIIKTKMSEIDNSKEDTNNTVPSDTILNHLEISVAESEKRVTGSLNLRDYYTVYLIEIK